METLLEWLNARTFTAAAVLAAAVYLAAHFQQDTRNWYRHWRYTSLTEKTSLADTIQRDLDRQASVRLRALHRQVSEEISRAVASGQNVGSLQATADGLLLLDTPAGRMDAIDRLQRLRLAIPKRSTKLRVLNDEDDAEEIAEPRTRSAVRRRRSR